MIGIWWEDSCTLCTYMVNCAQFSLCDGDYYMILIFLNSFESELIYVENKGCHWRRVCDTLSHRNGVFHFLLCSVVLSLSLRYVIAQGRPERGKRAVSG